MDVGTSERFAQLPRDDISRTHARLAGTYDWGNANGRMSRIPRIAPFAREHASAIGSRKRKAGEQNVDQTREICQENQDARGREGGPRASVRFPIPDFILVPSFRRCRRRWDHRSPYRAGTTARAERRSRA
jgi:hypothetical protein